MKYFIFFISCFASLSTHLSDTNAQPIKTANDNVNTYTGSSFFGVNMGYYPGWSDKNLAEIAAGKTGVQGIGATTLRPTLPENFLEQWGYNIRVNDFQYYKSLGLTDLTVFLQTPSDAHKSSDKYCGNNSSLLFSNMYLPIWDGGLNGTPVNDKNYYALYVYKTVTAYKANVKFWEIMNEPDFTYSSHGWEDESAAGNWWKNNPNPCDLTNMQAPIQHYVRLLRISYEVIKTIDPAAYITTGGIGYPSFLDAILRNTDNPDNGNTTAEFPLKGGAYFDVLSFHVYPTYEPEMQKMNNSDGGALGLIGKKNRLENVLVKYGYNGIKFPKKELIITETNVGRKTIGNEYGSNHLQRNYVIKSSVMAIINNIKQLHFFVIGDGKTLESANDNYAVMGMYQPLAGTTPFNQKPNDQAIANKTVADLLQGANYEPLLTSQMNTSTDVFGAAFIKKNKIILALWAKTTVDKSEAANKKYLLPLALQGKKYDIYEWDYAKTNSLKSLTENSIMLSGDPIFLVGELPNGLADNEEINRNYMLSPNPTVNKHTTLQFLNPIEVIHSLQLLDLNGKILKNLLYDNSEKTNISINFEGIPQGTYIIQAVTKSQNKMILINID